MNLAWFAVSLREVASDVLGLLLGRAVLVGLRRPLFEEPIDAAGMILFCTLPVARWGEASNASGM